MASSTDKLRRGRGSKAYKRQRDAMEMRYRRHGWPCPECDRPFDFEHPQSSRGFTADHPVALRNGGKLVGQKLVAMCRGCNARKNDVLTPTLTPATEPPRSTA